MALPWTTIGRIILLIVLVAAMVTACLKLPIEKILEHFMVWLKNDVGPWGPFILILAYIPATVLAVPGSILTLGGGYVFGFPVGFAADSIGSTAGAAAAFVVGRTIGRSYVVSKLKVYPQFTAIAAAVEHSGFKIVLLLRLVPLLPFNVMNYLLSITPLRVPTYTMASWIGMMPSTAVLVYVGTTLKSIADIAHGGADPPSKWKWLFLGAGLILSVLVLGLVTLIAKNALTKALEEEKERIPDATIMVVEEATITILPSSSDMNENVGGELREPLMHRVETPTKTTTSTRR